MYTQYLETPIGILKLVANEHALREVSFADILGKEEPNAITQQTAKQLQEYFEGKRTIFDLPLEPEGTAFQKRVWKELKRIPYGETKSYGQIAQAIGNPNASRAVGMANNRNPIVIIIPCHRVIGANGRLVGYGGGLDKKVYLLTLEKVLQ